MLAVVSCFASSQPAGAQSNACVCLVRLGMDPMVDVVPHSPEEEEEEKKQHRFHEGLTNGTWCAIFLG